MKNTVCIIIRNKLGQYLGVSRKQDYSSFGLPGGKCEEGEMPIIAALRELKEETTLDLYYLKLLDVRYYEFDKPCYKGNDTVYCFVGNLQPDFILPSDENRKEKNEGVVRWVSKAELFDGCFGEYHQEIISLFETSAQYLRPCISEF